MKKTKKGLLAFIACTMALSGAVGLSACEDDVAPGVKPHAQHNWSSWTVEVKPDADNPGKAKRTCSADGVCLATASDKEYELPPLEGSDGYTKGNDTATCTDAGEVTYTYDKDGVNVTFAAPSAINPDAHDYGNFINTDPQGHYKECSHNHAHTTVKTPHDTAGTDGACSVCGYKAEKIAVGDKHIASLDTTGVTMYFDGCEAGTTYKLSSANDKVKFYVGTEQGNPVTFDFSTGTASVSVVSTDGVLSDVTIKLEVAVVEEEVPLVEVNKDVVVTGAGDFEPKKYKINLADGAYQLYVGGAPVKLTADADVVVGYGYTDGELDLVEAALGYDKTFGVSDGYNYHPAGTYYLHAYKDVTFKVVKTNEHMHEFDATRWDSDNTGHFHPAICGEDGAHGNLIHGPTFPHDFGDWSAPDADGVKTKACSVCGYQTMEVEGTKVDGSRSDTSPTGLTGLGNFIASIGAVKDPTSGKYSPAGEFYNVVCGDTAKKYTVKLLTTNSTLTPSAAGYDGITEVGDTFTFVLETGEKFLFNVTSNDWEVAANYSYNVAFRITAEDAPEIGDILRPVRAAVGDNGKDSVAAGEKVYFRISSKNFSDDLTITFGDGVTLYDLGKNRNNDGTPVSSGYTILAKNYVNADVYLYAVSTGADCKINIAETAAPGSKKNPIAATADGANDVALTMDAKEQWFVFTAPKAATFEFKASDADGRLDAYIGTESSPSKTGHTVLIELAEGDVINIKAYHNLNKSFSFTVAESASSTAGTSASDPVVITESGEYTLPPNSAVTTAYVSFTAEENCVLVITYTPDPALTGDAIKITCTAASVRKATNTATINAKKGTTYSILLTINSAKQTPIKITAEVTPS